MRSNKRIKVCVITGSRAEYGLLYWLMREIADDPKMTLQLVVTGAHLIKRFGSTYREILEDGFKITARVKMDLRSDRDEAIAGSVGVGVKRFGKVFNKLKPDVVVILGDRFEMLAAASAALICRVPIAHLHGGEVTEGAFDDAIRHAITKMASLHFVAHKDYARRVIQMGEHPDRVFVVGALGLDNIRKLKLLNRKELGRALGFDIGKDVALVTFHPETRAKGAAGKQVANLISALDRSKLRVVFTMSNADPENRVIIEKISAFVKKNGDRAKLFRSLGQKKYLSLLREAGLMVGNSSSGILEAPSFALPVVNIGRRQEGRIKAKNIIDSSSDAKAIGKAIRTAGSAGFRRSLKGLTSPFGDGRASRKVKKVLAGFDLAGTKPGFRDLT